MTTTTSVLDSFSPHNRELVKSDVFSALRATPLPIITLALENDQRFSMLVDIAAENAAKLTFALAGLLDPSKVTREYVENDSSFARDLLALVRTVRGIVISARMVF